MAEEREDGEKTEEPSHYRLEEFRKKGEVASSKELNSVILLAGTLMTLILCAAYIYEEFGAYLEWLMRRDVQKIYEQKQFVELVQETAWFALKCVGPVFGASLCLGFLSQFAQIGFLWSPDLLSANFERINPINGLQRLLSKKALVEAVKGVFKFAVVLIITWSILKAELPKFMGFMHTEVGPGMAFGKGLIIKLGYSILLGLAVVALADFGWEKWSYRQKLMMTKQEVKQEAKEKDGNPEIKQKIRQIQRQMAQKRMMDDVKKADVIVTNPTHLSVALKYDGETMVAPAVVAKGADHLALRIREIAKEHDIPMVENVVLARTLYKTVKTGDGVPRTLYRAVAEILAFVYKLRRRRKALE